MDILNKAIKGLILLSIKSSNIQEEAAKRLLEDSKSDPEILAITVSFIY